MNIGIDVRCLMDKERSGVGEYVHQYLNNLFEENQNKELKDEFFLFFNSWSDVSGNLPKWNYLFVHYCGFRWPNKFLNFCLKFLKWPRLDRLIVSYCHPERAQASRRISKDSSSPTTTQNDGRNVKYKLDKFIFPNQNFYALSPGVKKMIIVHDLSQEIYSECFSPKSRLWHKFVNLKKMTQDADEIIAVSENTKLDLINLHKINPSKIKVVYPKIKTHNLQRTTYNLGNYILFLGTIEPRKNVSGLLKAYELLYLDPNVSGSMFHASGTLPNLLIVGKSGYKSKEVFRFWETMKAKDKVKFLGYVSEEEKWKLYQGARVFVYPALYEGFGMPVAEAMSVGVPVITSLISSMHEVVKGKGTLVDPNRVEDLAKAIGSLLKVNY